MDTEKHKAFFKTDGIRGTVGKWPITPEFMLKLGWATGRVFSKAGGGKVLIGKDTRISGYMFESALEAGVTSAGVDINLLGPMPTPAVAYLTRTFRAQAGIVISASHNGFQDNGIKFFSGEGAKLDDEIEEAIEATLEEPMTTVPAGELGKATRIDDASGRFVEFCKSAFHRSVTLNGLNIVLDCANGATYHIAPSVFQELGASVHAIGNQPDGMNINHGCGSTMPASLVDQVLARQADMGIAFDGDGDRVIMVDHKGELVDGDELLFIIALYKLGKNPDGQGVVGTAMSNLGLELALGKADIPFARTRVGDRYIMSELLSRKWKFGGESSGHIICLDTTTTGDGIVAALQVLAALKTFGQNLHDLKSRMEKLPQTMINVSVNKAELLADNRRIKSAINDAEATLGTEGRVLLRPSGTEPVVRVMVEGVDALLVSRLAKELSEVVAREVA